MRYLINSLDEKETQLHMHSEYEIIVYTEGKGQMVLEDGRISVAPGQIVIVPPGVLHGAESKVHVARIYIRGRFEHIFSFSFPMIVADNEEREGTMLGKMILRNRFAKSEYVESLVDAFAHFLTQSIQMKDKIGIAVEKLANQISYNFYDSGLDLQKLLSSSGYAEDYIRDRFKKLTGKTPVAYLTNVRISHACYLIDTYKNTLSLMQIAEKCGFNDYVYFSKKFKGITGVSPREYIEKGK